MNQGLNCEMETALQRAGARTFQARGCSKGGKVGQNLGCLRNSKKNIVVGARPQRWKALNF